MPTAAPLKRLSRPEIPPKSFRITPRVFEILARVAQFRFLTSEQIARLDGGSHQKVLRLLQLCFYHGLLDRPANQHALLASFFDEGNRPLVYAISRKGAKVLAEVGIAVDADLQWVSKNRTATIPFLAHTIEVAETVMQFAFASRDLGATHLIDHHDLVPAMPPATQALHDPFRLRVKHRTPDYKEVSINVVPDRLFALDNTERRVRWYFALELDRGTMSNGTASTKLHGKSSYRRKLIGYFEAWKQGRHTAQWGCKSFRLLTVTTSEKRIQHMLDVQREITNNTLPGFFLYTTRERMAEHGVLGPAWISAERDDVSLLARP
jgi:hypothetical protein